MNAAAIEARGVRKRFGRAVALRDLDLRLAPGESLAVLGPNGAGKSTLLRLLAGLSRPSAGQVLLDAHPPSHRASRARVGYLGHATGLASSLTVRENLLFAARLYGSPDPHARADAGLRREGLEALAGRRVAALSRGQAQRVAIARALIHEPALWLLDEPFTGLDQAASARLAEHLGGRERTAVWATHALEPVRSLADRALVLAAGRPLWCGPVPGEWDALEAALARALAAGERAA